MVQAPGTAFGTVQPSPYGVNMAQLQTPLRGRDGGSIGGSGVQQLLQQKRTRRLKRSIVKQMKDSGSHWGVHRLLSTGTLAPPILKAFDSMDLIFSTHWVYPSKVPVLQPEDVKCIEKFMKGKAFETDEDMDAFEIEV